VLKSDEVTKTPADPGSVSRMSVPANSRISSTPTSRLERSLGHAMAEGL
jgi:hypothetical protein